MAIQLERRKLPEAPRREVSAHPIDEECELFENRWIGTYLGGASLKESDLSRGVFSEDVWGQFSMQGANLCHAELEGLDPRKVDTTGVKIVAWQQEQLLESMGIVVMPD